MNKIETFDSERIFKNYVNSSAHHLADCENVEYGKDFIKFKEKSTGKSFIIFVKEELIGKKIIVSERSTEKRVKKTRPAFYKPT